MNNLGLLRDAPDLFLASPALDIDLANVANGSDGVQISLLEAVLTGMAQVDGKERLLLLRNGKLVTASKFACRLLDQIAGVRLDHGTLCLSSPGQNAAFKRLLSVGADERERSVFEDRNGSCHHIATAIFLGGQIVLVTIKSPQPSFQPDLPDLCDLFGLTRCESVIIASIFSGKTPQVIAEEQDISIHTVRAHLRHCYDKLDVNCREELWTKLLPYCENGIS